MPLAPEVRRNLERTYHYFLADENNTPFTVRMLCMWAAVIHAWSGRRHHWHMNCGHKVEYLGPPMRAVRRFPMSRVTELSQGVVTEFRTPKFTTAVDEASLRKWTAWTP